MRKSVFFARNVIQKRKKRWKQWIIWTIISGEKGIGLDLIAASLGNALGRARRYSISNGKDWRKRKYKEYERKCITENEDALYIQSLLQLSALEACSGVEWWKDSDRFGEWFWNDIYIDESMLYRISPKISVFLELLFLFSHMQLISTEN